MSSLFQYKIKTFYKEQTELQTAAASIFAHHHRVSFFSQGSNSGYAALGASVGCRIYDEFYYKEVINLQIIDAL